MARAPVTSESLPDEINEDFLSCSICLDIYKNPTVLPCLHTFCQQCLVTLKAKSGGVLKCATCRIQCDTPIKKLKSNLFLSSLLHTYQTRLSLDHSHVCEICQEKIATHRCVDCLQFICDECFTIHKRIPTLRYHEVLTIAKYKEIESRGHLTVQSKVICSVHKDSDLEFYCETCQVPVCYKCTKVKHRIPAHRHRDLQEVADKYKTQLREMLGLLKVKEKQAEAGKSADESARAKIRDQCEAEKRKVITRAKEMTERIQKEGKMLIDALDKKARMGLKDVEMNIDEKQFNHGNIVSMHHYLETLLHHGNSVHLLSTRIETMKRINEMVAMEIKPPITHDITEFQPGSDLAAHALMGVIKSDVCPSKCTVENIPKQLLKGESVKLLITTRDSRGMKTISRKDVKVKTGNPYALWDNTDVTCNKDGTFNVVITGSRAGRLQIAMKIGHQQILRSPLYIDIINGLVQTVGTTGSEGKLNRPMGLTINKHGDFVTADYKDNRVTIHDRDGNYKQSFRFTERFAKPFRPWDVAISDDNEYFMLDHNNRQVVVSDVNEKLIRCFGCPQIDNPCGIAINPVNKNVYVSEWNGDCIRKYTHRGVYIKSFGDSGDKQGEFICPCMLAINSKGLVYIPDCYNNRIQVFNSDDQFMFEFSSNGDSPMNRPKGVAIDKNDYVYVSSLHEVTKYDSYGQFICRIDSDNDALSSPWGVACNAGRVAVVSRGNDCIKVFVE
uniref:Tripartite motif-containing protein 2-like n=1 Tax=Saccoglossus kowalevskii TaxID=10224 RepID=A0ABM0MFU2_SACKO|nr:PREDICTED: tripartite motif-containing protein 2-like [Saccoglossus kowalevskii]